MKRINLIAFILQIVFGVICVGMGIYYCFSGDIGQIAIFFVVGIICFVNAVRIYINDKKGNKDE